jgi:hypothetical protein
MLARILELLQPSFYRGELGIAVMSPNTKRLTPSPTPPTVRVRSVQFNKSARSHAHEIAVVHF